jgi:hypothetical protein
LVVGRKLVIALALVRILPVDPVDPACLASLASLASLVDPGNLACLADLVEPLSLALLLGSIVGRALGPCTLWNRHGILLFHIDCRHRLPGDWDGKSIDRVLEL